MPGQHQENAFISQSGFYKESLCSSLLSSTTAITDANGSLTQHVLYFAYGEQFVDEHRNSTNSPYLFNGKEYDEETGRYYYGARYYDPRVSLWIGVDPLAEERSWMSPYNYCQNNPIVRIDPDGMSDELTDFGVKNDGSIVRIGEIDKNPDRLFAVNDDLTKKDVNNDGKISNGDFETIYDKSILPSLEKSEPGKTENLTTGKYLYNYKTNKGTYIWDQKQLPYAVSSSKNDTDKVFRFAASNSNVEWGLSGNKNGKWAVGTINENAQAPMFSKIQGFEKQNIIYREHSHSGSHPRIDFTPSTNDITNARLLKQINPNAKSYLFMPKNPLNKKIEIK